MRAALAVHRLLSRLNFSRMDLDFLFDCHNLSMDFDLGGCVAIGNDSARPLFSFPHPTSKATTKHPKKREAGSDFLGLGRGQQAAVAGAGSGLRETGRYRRETTRRGMGNLVSLK